MDAGTAFVAAFATVFTAELGDRTQLTILLAASQVERPWALFLAAVGAFTVSGVLATALGAGLGELLPVAWLQLAGGALFLGFGVGLVWAFLRRADVDEGAESLPTGGRFVLAMGTAILLAEMGDKTQITTGLLAATAPPVAVFLGATAALAGNAAIAVVVGRQLRHLPDHLRRWVQPIAAVVFLGFGALYVVRGAGALM